MRRLVMLPWSPHLTKNLIEGEPGVAELEPDLTLEARRLVVSVEDRGTAKALVIVSDDVSIEILSEPGALTTAAGGFEELAREAFALAEILRARATEAGVVHPLTPRFTGARGT